MNVLVFSGLFYPAKLGGPANTLYWQAKALVENGVGVTVVATNHYIDSSQIAFNKWLNLDGIRVRYCSKASPFGFRQVFHAGRVLNRCDVIELSSLCYLPNFFVYLLSIIKKKKVVWSPRGELFDSAVKGNRLKKTYFSILHLFLSKRVTFHVTSEQERNLVYQYFPEETNTVVIPNYFVLPRCQTREIKGEPYFIYVGRINPIKALDNILLGLAKSKLFLQSNYKILFVGQDQDGYKKSLESLSINLGIESRVDFCQGLYGEDKFRAFANASFSFLMSYSENFGNVVIESLSQGTPVVASTGTPWKLLNENNAGFWIDNDPNIIASCVDTIINLSNDEYEQMRNSAMALACSFDVNSNIRNWINLFEMN